LILHSFPTRRSSDLFILYPQCYYPMFGWFSRKNKSLLNKQEQAIVITAIQEAERRTSGEVRVFVESHCSYVDSMDRAREVFFKRSEEHTSELQSREN